ncbi:ADP-ribosylation factor GTPase-activating protein [Musa troglodytarum]|uniref:ADP-ribosylation factor GTPase-activating protein n=1 Tax=Musa troglodytarum TaxID=320322 RepID=A0A9E7F303_9LILI|nr:ADP-ribosylation factor GTPase-activating protein [Musa troglodytarum]
MVFLEYKTARSVFGVLCEIFLAMGTTLGADLLVSSRFLHLNQKLKTSVKKNSLNPEWNEDLTLCVTDPIQPLKLEVYDKDTFTPDDIMGDAELDIRPFMDAIKMDLAGIPNVTIITTVRPSRQNCLADDSHISRKDGTVAQDVVLRLRNVESGEVELQLLWVNIPHAQDI